MNQVRGKNSAFTLIEILIVVTILGILAAVVFPEYQSHAQQAKESTAKNNLRMLRQAIELYATQHRGIAPGYINGDIEGTLFIFAFKAQLVTMATNEQGQCQQYRTVDYPYGPYLSDLPKNPFNNEITITFLSNTDEFPTEASGDTGWIYKAFTKTIRLNWPGTDSKGVNYYDY